MCFELLLQFLALSYLLLLNLSEYRGFCFNSHVFVVFCEFFDGVRRWFVMEDITTESGKTTFFQKLITENYFYRIMHMHFK